MSNGNIVQCIGPVVDIQFPRDKMPNIYDALTLVESGEKSFAEKGLTFEVQQQIGDTPHLDVLIGAITAQLEAFERGEIDAVYLAYTRFVNAMKQEPVLEKLLPLEAEALTPEEQTGNSWDYIYEPDAESILNGLLKRYVEAMIYQAVAENMASEQSARMVSMKAASDNAKNVIGELQLDYNKTRQAAITKELSEIVGGAAAV